ncbi:cell differentiation family [Heterostelium album PN500]|uniref:Cell differentiation family n=1 Tax=Heterostelium pallidum (strain ATCC 26659 / Pp 5 / PN500) TaxID=670386 RepID=D3B2T6_HETP5|nr:cell differentiation family [Heterostelium album PN500]EFA83634.1 cell differentiation family [Heterostelium album PN500]|eukprot:XP_020435751.1 cell differentiation family [Heterostelium album PN500]
MNNITENGGAINKQSFNNHILSSFTQNDILFIKTPIMNSPSSQTSSTSSSTTQPNESRYNIFDNQKNNNKQISQEVPTFKNIVDNNDLYQSPFQSKFQNQEQSTNIYSNSEGSSRITSENNNRNLLNIFKSENNNNNNCNIESINKSLESNIKKGIKIPVGEKTINQLILDLYENDKREETLSEIIKRKDSIPNLHLYISYSPMIMTILLQEVLSIYRYILPPNQKLKARSSNRVCNTLALLQLVASNLESRSILIKSRIIVYLFPFLKTGSRNKPFEYLRLSTLNVISALIKVEIRDVIKLLLDSDLISSCLKIMETCSELSKTVSTFILQKILNEDEGLNYFCQSPTRLQQIFHSLNSMIEAMLPDHMSSRLLKHIVRCYLRLSDNLKARDMLSKSIMPECFSNGQLNDFLNQEGDMIVKRWYHQLMTNVFPQQQQQQPPRRSPFNQQQQQQQQQQQYNNNRRGFNRK